MDTSPNPSGGQARTKLDLLYREVLGEVASLVDRLEAIGHSQDQAQPHIQALTEALHLLPQQLDRHLAATLREVATPIHEQSQHAMQAMLDATGTRLTHLAEESAQCARITRQAARRMTVLAMVIGGASGILGGMLAGLALGQWLVS